MFAPEITPGVPNIFVDSKPLIIEGYTWEEIAERLEISINTVKTQKTRSYKFLRERLGDSMNSIILCLFL